MSRLQLTFGALILVQAAHSIEEYVGRLWESFPPTRFVTGLVSSNPERDSSRSMCCCSRSAYGASFGRCGAAGRLPLPWGGSGRCSKLSTASAICCGRFAKGATLPVWPQRRFCLFWRFISRISCVARMRHHLRPNRSLNGTSRGGRGLSVRRREWGAQLKDRAQAVVFIVAALAISWGFEAFIIVNGGVRNFGLIWIVALMCIPGVLSIALRFILSSGFGDVGFRIGKGRYYIYAVAIPFLLVLLVGVASAALDIRRFAPVPLEELIQLKPVLLSVLGLGLIGAFGEELGWRGFLLPKLVSGGVTNPYLVCGLVWASWHLPLIAFGGFYQTDNGLLMALIYGLGIIAMSFLFSELRMRSGSVWVPAIAHAAHNFFFQFAVPVLLLTAPGSRSEFWDSVAGDTGLCIAVLYSVAYLVLRHVVRRRRTFEVVITSDNSFKR